MYHLEGKPRCRFLGFRRSHSSWKPEEERTLMTNSHCTKKKDFILPCSGPLWEHCNSPVLPRSWLQKSINLSNSLSGEPASLLLLLWPCPKQHKVSCPQSHQRQNSLETEPEAPVSVSIRNKPDVCRANLQGSFSSNHETDFKKNESPARKILLKLAWYYSGKSYLGKGFIFLSALSCSFHSCKQQSGTLGYFTPYY